MWSVDCPSEDARPSSCQKVPLRAGGHKKARFLSFAGAVSAIPERGLQKHCASASHMGFINVLLHQPEPVGSLQAYEFFSGTEPATNWFCLVEFRPPTALGLTKLLLLFRRSCAVRAGAQNAPEI